MQFIQDQGAPGIIRLDDSRPDHDLMNQQAQEKGHRKRSPLRNDAYPVLVLRCR